jgi:hypothetical protein
VSDHVALTDFPVRPPLRKGESLASWCWRIYLANGHDVPPGVRSATRKFRAEPEMEVDHVLASLIGIDTLSSFRARENGILDRWCAGLVRVGARPSVLPAVRGRDRVPPVELGSSPRVRMCCAWLPVARQVSCV